MTMSSSVILLKFWMDFKLGIMDRKYHKPTFDNNPLNARSNMDRFFVNKIYNKKSQKDIIIDCEVEVINGSESSISVSNIYTGKERLLK